MAYLVVAAITSIVIAVIISVFPDHLKFNSQPFPMHRLWPPISGMAISNDLHKSSIRRTERFARVVRIAGEVSFSG